MSKGGYTDNPWVQKSKLLNWNDLGGNNGSTRFDKHSYSTFVSKSGVIVNGLPGRNTRRVYQHEFEMRKSMQNIKDEDMFQSVPGGRRHYKIESNVEIAHPESRLVFDQDKGVDRVRNTKYFHLHTMTSPDHPLNTQTIDATRPSTAPSWQVGTLSHGIIQGDHYDPQMANRKRHVVKHLYDRERVEENLRDDRNVEKMRNTKNSYIHKYEEVRKQQQDLRTEYPHGVPRKVAIEAQKKLLDVGVAGYESDLLRPFTRAGYRP